MPIVSRDEIRFSMLQDSDEYFSHENEVFDAFINAIVSSCKAFGGCVIDATHISKGSRRKLFHALDAQIKGKYDTSIFYFDIPVEICLQRNQMREGRAKVPEEVILDMYRHFVFPSCNEHESIKQIWKNENENRRVMHLDLAHF